MTGEIIEEINKVTIYPSSHYVVGEEKLKKAIKTIADELRERLMSLMILKKDFRGKEVRANVLCWI